MRSDRMLDLRTTDSDGDEMIHRPQLRLWIEDEDEMIQLSVGPEYGGSQRYVSMTAAEARHLAKYLSEIAQEAIDRTIVNLRRRGQIDGGLLRSDAEEAAIRDNEAIQRRQGKLPRQLED